MRIIAASQFLIFSLTLMMTLVSKNGSAGSQSNLEFYDWVRHNVETNQYFNTNRLIWSDEIDVFLDRNITHHDPLYLGMTGENDAQNFEYHLRSVLGGAPDDIDITDQSTIFLAPAGLIVAMKKDSSGSTAREIVKFSGSFRSSLTLISLIEKAI